MHWSFGILILWIIQLSQMLAYFIVKCKMFYLLMLLIIRKVFEHWKTARLTLVDTIFLKFWFSLQILNLILGNKTVSCFPWSDSLIGSLLRKFLPNTHVQINMILHWIKWKWQSLKKVAHSAHKSSNCPTVDFETTIILQYVAGALFEHFPFHQIIKNEVHLRTDI